MGGIDFYRDGRTVNDNVEAIFRYPGGRTFLFSSLLNNHKVGCQQWIYGTKGSVELTIQDATFYYEESRERAKLPSTAEIVEKGVVTGATYSTRGEMPYRGTGERIETAKGLNGNPNYLACKSFIDNLRDGKRPLADERVGFEPGVAVALANKAIDKGERLVFADYT